jgi:hypothetical protein
MEFIMNSDRQWLAHLSRRGWAWEFLRRNPEYRAMYNAGGGSAAANWGLLHFADPSLDALTADVFWHPDDCTDVLPMTFCADEDVATGVTLDLRRLSCRIAFASDQEVQRRDILFSEEGRFLQLAIFGDGNWKGATLMVAALDEPNTVMARTASLRRLNDLLFNKTMRKVLYPPESRAPRLINVLFALDGWLAQLPQREIAATMFGKARVEREWNDPRENLRDQVRRAIGYGQDLMNGGYRQFLRLTFARRIAATQGAPRA